VRVRVRVRVRARARARARVRVRVRVRACRRRRALPPPDALEGAPPAAGEERARRIPFEAGGRHLDRVAVLLE